ncbi:MAG: hypothetical protein GX660_27070 [Clostridiaceae bacterium]|nr:hypothetical protein [Clostridiaceae bacterium]
MKRRIVGLIIIIGLILLAVSCSSKEGNHLSENQDMIIPPESDLNQFQNSNLRNVGSANNAYQQNIVNKLYDRIGINGKAIDFDVNEIRMYVLNKKDSTDNGTEYGDTIDIYGIENGKLEASVALKGMNSCTAIDVHGEELYAYDYKKGSIIVFSSDGSYKQTFDFGYPELDIKKIQVDDSGRIYLMASGKALEKACIYVYDRIKPPFIIDANQLGKPLYDGQKDSFSFYIQDFCVRDAESILIRVVPERICLYNINSHKVEKVSYLPVSANLIDFDSGILYYSSEMKVSVLANSFANYQSEGNHNYVGRLLINDRFAWSLDPTSLTDFQLGEIIIPYESQKRSKMKQNNKYLFFLDYNIEENASNRHIESSIYRISK